VRLATLKLVGYTEVLHCLHSRMHEDTSVLLFGGLAKDRPYPGSTTVTRLERVLERTPTGRLVTMDDVTGAALFLLENRAINGVNLAVDGGWVIL
jgi:NAD(P)-dependent dehydrogenase (short-subunit alcohol dehydrogenase family)